MVVGEYWTVFLVLNVVYHWHLGCDVSHPAPHIRDRPSLASVVYSMNSTATQYKVHLDCQAPRQEIIEHLAEMLKACLLLLNLHLVSHLR